MKWLAIGAGCAFLAVGLGAFGAHALKERLTPDLLAVYQTGVQYHFYHSVALALVGLVDERLPAARRSGALFAVGIVLFSGSLYLLALTGLKWLGAITPLGGLCFLSGWAWLALSAARRR